MSIGRGKRIKYEFDEVRFMLYADSYYKYIGYKTGSNMDILLPELSKFEKFIWKLKGYRLHRLPEDPEREEYGQ